MINRGFVGTAAQPLRTLFIGIMTLTGLVGPAAAASPFVSGFDRFGRHEEIDQSLAGQLLLTELSCTACHRTNREELAPKSGPRLDGAGNRINSDWTRRFLFSPQSTKPGTTMPDVLASVPEDKRGKVVEALVAFLSSQRQDFPELKAGGSNPIPHEFWNKGEADRGRALYHRVGCVACHEADPEYETVETKPSPLDQLLEQLDPEELAEMGLAAAVRPVNSVPHAELPQKYTRRSLTYFLINPEKTRRSGRMPSLKLKAMEAAHIAAWLLPEQQGSGRLGLEPDAALIEKGRSLFAELRCANCHSAADVKPVAAKSLSKLSLQSEIHCLGQASPGLPHYSLDEAQVRAIRFALETDGSLPLDSPDGKVQFRMLKLNCYACHEREEVGGVGRNRRPYFETVGHIDVGDEGRIPPPLSGVGRKLFTPWIEKVLAGSGDVRPHLQARMPKFPAGQVESLPQLLAMADQEGASTAKIPFEDIKGLEPAGRALMDVGCVQCHPFRGDALPGVVGIDLIGVTSRLHPEWFYEFLLNPSELKPRTRMPSFFPNGKSQHPDILEGDYQQQIAAMWAYLKAGENQPLPEKIEVARNQNYELTPSERPIVLRTFMPEAGTHAIAVGFPQGVHIAFDAEQVRLAQAWKGRFLDAQGTWFSRVAPPAEPLGESVISLPPGPPVAFLGDDSSPWPRQLSDDRASQFDGYRIDPAGVPTFLYHFGSVTIEDRIEPDKEATLIRRLSLRSPAKKSETLSVFLRPLVGESLKRAGDRTYVNENGLSVSINGDSEGRLRQGKEIVEWIVPLDPQTDTSIEVRYSW